MGFEALQALGPTAAALLQAIDGPVLVCELDGRVQCWNSAAQTLFERLQLPLERECDVFRCFAEGTRGQFQRIRSAVSVGERVQADLMVASSAESFSTRWHPLPIHAGDGKAMAVILDGSSRSAAAEGAPDVLRRALDAITEGVVVADLDQQAIYTNRAFNQLAGGEAGRQLAMGNVVGVGGGSDELRRTVRRHLDVGESFRGEIEGSDETGKPYWHEIVVTPLKNDVGEPTHFVGVREDITKRKLIERSLEESRSRLQALITTAMDGILSFDEDHRIVLINHAASSMFRLPESEALGKSIEALIPAILTATHVEPLRSVEGMIETPHVMGRLGELHGVRSDGEAFPVEVSISQVQVHGRLLFTVILRDISARRESERVLQASQRRFKSIFEHSIDGILLMDDDGRYLDANPAACRLLGYTRDEIVALDIRRVVLIAETGSIEQVWQDFLRTGSSGGELPLRRKDGTSVPVEYSAIADILDGLHLAIMRDITERQALQEQLLRQQRLDSVGRLASGLAHDLNNILTPILMVPGMLRGRVQDATSLNLLDLLEQGARRGAAIVEQLLTFARERPGERKLQHIGSLIETAARLMRETFPKNIEIDLRLDQQAWPCLGDATQLQQLLLNLALNAKDAMPHGGKLTIALTNEQVTPEQARITPGAKPGPHVVLSAVDTGRGIEPQHLGRIFDPFFTTKPLGEATGLGLSAALGIARHHGGFITVRSRPAHGATFRVYLPAVGAEGALAAPTAAERMNARGEVVLVVDDEEDLRLVARQLLTQNGYEVICAKDGEAALTQLKAAGHRVDLVLTDLAMPGMGGDRLVALLRRRNPALRIIVMSGRDLEAASPAERVPAHGFLRKPFTAEELLHALAKAQRPASLPTS